MWNSDKMKYFIGICSVACSILLITFLLPVSCQKALEQIFDVIKICIAAGVGCYYYKIRHDFGVDRISKLIWSFALFFLSSAAILATYNLYCEIFCGQTSRWIYNLSWHLTAIGGFIGFLLVAERQRRAAIKRNNK